MTRTITIFGLLSGLVLGLFVAIVTITMKDAHSSSMITSMIFGYAMMLVAFSVIFVAVKNYRDKYLDGTISFGRAFTIGIGITLIGCAFYVVTWLILYATVVPDFMEKYMSAELEHMRKAGKPALEIQKHAAEMNKYAEMYQTWYGRALLTFIEVFPIGLAMTLASAITNVIISARRKKAAAI